MKIKLFLATFEETISASELSWFRGAMINLADNDPIFHNHLNENFNYSYPKIQYKIINNHPAILGIEDGAEKIRNLLSGDSVINCKIGYMSKNLHVASLEEWHDNLGISLKQNTYIIENWLPLNERNYQKYRKAEGLGEGTRILERILIGNILSFAKGMGMFFESQIECGIVDLKSNGNLNYKGVGLLSFSGVFKSNVELPLWIGLGKSSSLNHGIVIKI